MVKREEDRPDFEALSAEQADTDRLVRRLFGTAIADRYVDFCRLCSGRLPLKVSRPLAGHALRELDSSIRSVLAAPMDALPQEDEQQAKRRADALRALKDMKFDEETLQRADNALKPRLNHRTQIERIVKQLGLAPDGDVAKLWIELTRATGRVHERSFHERLEADEAFRVEFARKFDTVIRAVVTQLQDRYVALTRRAKEIAGMRPADGVKIFRREIPGAIPLQRYFYQNLNEDWLPFLEKEGLLGEPLPDEKMADLSRLRTWPAGQFLVRMASSSREETRTIVARALRAVGSSTHPDVQHEGLEVVATLPAAEAAELVDVVENWLTPESASASASPHALIKKLADGYMDAALRVTATVFQVSRHDGEAASFFDPTIYDHYLMNAVDALEKAEPLLALPRFCDFLMEASRLDRHLAEVKEEDYSYYMVMSLEPSPTDGGDVLSAIIRAIVRFSEAAIERDPSAVRHVLGILGGYSPRIFRRIALHSLARCPEAAPDLAEHFLTDKELIAAYWCREEYGRLARAWFARLPAERQREIFDFIESSSEELIEAWHPNFEAHYKRKAGPEDDRAFREASFRDVVWEWQDVLPPDRKAAFEKTVSEFGGRDAWKARHFQQEQLTLTRSDMQQQPVDDTVAHLAGWNPAPDAQGRTVPGLAFELRESVAASPHAFSAGAAKFAGLRPVFIRHLLDGLRQPAANGVALDWGTCFDLLDAVIVRLKNDAKVTLAAGDDTDWSWTVRSAIDLLAASLRRGAEGIPFAHADRVRSLVLALHDAVKRMPGGEHDNRTDLKHRYLSAIQTGRGAAVDLCVLFIFWQSKDEESVIGQAASEAIAISPDIRGILDVELADKSAAGWISRAVLGRYINWLAYYGEEWLRERFSALFPADHPELAAAAWLGYIEHSRPVGPLFDLLRPYYVLHAQSLGQVDVTPGFAETANRLADYLMAHFLWEKLPDDLLQLFLRTASGEVRRHTMWFMGREMGAAKEYRLPAMAYFEQRLRSAIESNDPEPYRRELGTISQFFRMDVDQIWLLDELLKMLQAGFAPNDPFSVVDSLAKLLPEHVDKIVEVTDSLVRQPKVDGWIFAAQDHALRQILIAGKNSDEPKTAVAVKDIVSYLASRGNTGFLDLAE
ncbi:hypothetical protein ABIA99_006029 [Bradyrhizobium sp. LB12.1]|uniref:hypothetical protein n=1 Tax=Bradyrhizobium sp. LB12.1 TaxID=3156327 RepID=UPI003399458E